MPASRRDDIVSGSQALAPSSARTIYECLPVLGSQDGCEYFYQSNDDVEMVTPGWAPLFVSALRSLSPPFFSLALILASPSFPLHHFPALSSYGPAHITPKQGVTVPEARINRTFPVRYLALSASLPM